MDAPNLLAGLIIGFVVGMIVGGEEPDYSTYGDEVVEARYQCESVEEDYAKALKKANQNIEDGNYVIDDARSYAWADYEDMGYILESLEGIEEVRQPKVSCY